jgi:hypothetical protein
MHPTTHRRESGQVIVIFAGALVAIMGLIAIVVDISWYWSSTLKVQRAADAAALAGVVYLPGDKSSAYATALDEARKNGFVDGVGGTTVVPEQDPRNPRRLKVTIEAPIGTYFARVLGINSIPSSRVAIADYILPVPMGSPLNYYGIGCLDTNAVNGLSQPACASGSDSNGPSGVSSAQGQNGTVGGGAPNQLDSQGFWGAVFTKGGDSRNGDAFSPTNISNGGSSPSNPDYDPSGYGYTVEIPAGGGGAVYVFDATFCEMPRLGSGKAGTGDEWTGNLGGTNPGPVSTYFNLYSMQGTPLDLFDDRLVYSSGSLFENEMQVDQSGNHGTGSPAYASTAGMGRCDQATDPKNPYHLKWWQLPTGGLAEGMYRLQVTTTKVDTANGGVTIQDGSVNSQTGAANRFGLQVTSASGSPRVYGNGRMAAYANVQSGRQKFYLAQVDQASGAGKTVQIKLYDPGDVGGGAWLRFLNPDDGTQTPVTFSYTSVSKATGAPGPSGTNVTCIQTNRPTAAPPGGIPAGCPSILDGSGSQFDGYWVTITIPLAWSYGADGLWNNGWWQVEYTVGGGNDTTTWMVEILGNPVHLIVPN